LCVGVWRCEEGGDSSVSDLREGFVLDEPFDGVDEEVDAVFGKVVGVADDFVGKEEFAVGDDEEACAGCVREGRWGVVDRVNGCGGVVGCLQGDCQGMWAWDFVVFGGVEGIVGDVAAGGPGGGGLCALDEDGDVCTLVLEDIFVDRQCAGEGEDEGGEVLGDRRGAVEVAEDGQGWE